MFFGAEAERLAAKTVRRDRDGTPVEKTLKIDAAWRSTPLLELPPVAGGPGRRHEGDELFPENGDVITGRPSGASGRVQGGKPFETPYGPRQILGRFPRIEHAGFSVHHGFQGSAPGRGDDRRTCSHVIHYVNIAPSITLVDINKENIEFCKNRFSEFDKIEYIVNDGTHLTGISNGSATAVICYDSMVHFELLDIAIYLKEIYRILSVGGMALLHHSNYCGNPGAEYTKNPHLRNFMA